ncbi:hypothetical protein ACFL47_07740 [Candidatus Latescibacterota bacterium]
MTLMARTMIIVLLAVGCSTSGTVSVEARGKADDIQKKYPQDSFIVRSGTGDSPESASENARLEIAKFFESKISGETIVQETMKLQISGNKSKEQRMTQLSNSIKVSANRDIPGIEIAGTEKIRRSDSYEAWAVLDRSKYAGVLRDNIAKIDAEVDQLLSDTGGDDMKNLRDLTRVMNSLVERKTSFQDLSLLGGGATSARDNLLGAVITSLDSLIATSIDVGLVWDGEVGSEIKTAVTNGFSESGIRIREYDGISAAKDAGADLALRVRHDVSESERVSTINNKEYKMGNYDWVLSVDAVDPSTDQVIDTNVQREKISEMGGMDRAKGRMLSKIMSEQVPVLSSWLYEFLFKTNQ